MQDLVFSEPGWLYLGIALALATCFAFWYFDRKNRVDLGKFASGDLLEGYRTGVSKPLRWIKRACFVLGVLLLFAALARPLLGYQWKEVRRKGIDILFAIDSSKSMLAEDLPPSRLARTKLGMQDFVDRLDGDRIGLLPFAGSSFLLCPLTLDYAAFNRSLDAVDTDIIPHQGTDVASAIREADKIFEEAGNNHRILVILTDGEDLQGEALAAAKEAAKHKMVIYTVGIGSAKGAYIPIHGDFLRDQSGKPVKSKLDEAGLKAIAQATGGLYAPFGEHGEGLEKIYREKLALVPEHDLKQRMQKVAVERYQWPLGAAILLFLTDFILGDRRRPGKEKRKSAATAAKAVSAMLVCLLALSQTSHAESAPSSYNKGIAAFKKNDLEAAQGAFRKAISNTSDLSLQAKSYYNLGNTLFSLGAGKLENKDTGGAIGDWEKSLVAFEGALKLDPEDTDALHNRDYVKQKLEELKKQQQKKKQQDKKDQKNQKDQKDQKSGKDKKDSQGQKNQKPDEGKKDQKDKNGKGQQENRNKKNPSDQADQTDKKNQPGQKEPSDQKDKSRSKNNQQAGKNQPSSGKPADKKQGKDQAPPAGQAAATQQRRKPGEMSREEARQLLKALEKDEDKVILVPAGKEGQKGGFRQNNTTKGKDW